MNNTRNIQETLRLYQDIIDGLEQEIYVKNRHGTYLVANRFYINALIELELISKKNPTIIGKTDFDLFPADTAQQFFDNDQHVITTGVAHTFTEESQLSSKHTRRFVSQKRPLYKETGEIEGIIGYSKRIDFLILNNTQVELSKRELDCLAAIFKGLSAKKIADNLQLSKRTVESYIENLKIKMNCNNKADMIKSILNNNLENALKYHSS